MARYRSRFFCAFWTWNQILQSLRRLLIIFVGLKLTWYRKKNLIFTRCICGFMSILHKKSWTVANYDLWCLTSFLLKSDFQNLSNQISNYMTNNVHTIFWLVVLGRSIIKPNKLVNAQPVQLNFSVIYFYSAEGQKSRIL